MSSVRCGNLSPINTDSLVLKPQFLSGPVSLCHKTECLLLMISKIVMPEVQKSPTKDHQSREPKPSGRDRLLQV